MRNSKICHLWYFLDFLSSSYHYHGQTKWANSQKKLFLFWPSFCQLKWETSIHQKRIFQLCPNFATISSHFQLDCNPSQTTNAIICWSDGVHCTATTDTLTHANTHTPTAQILWHRDLGRVRAQTQHNRNTLTPRHHCTAVDRDLFLSTHCSRNAANWTDTGMERCTAKPKGWRGWMTLQFRRCTTTTITTANAKVNCVTHFFFPLSRPKTDVYTVFFVRPGSQRCSAMAVFHCFATVFSFLFLLTPTTTP